MHGEGFGQVDRSAREEGRANEPGAWDEEHPRSERPWDEDRPRGPRPPSRAPFRGPRPGGARPFDRANVDRRGQRPYVPLRPAVAADPSLALAPDEELVAGRRPVEEAFVARREAKRLYVVPQRRQALEKLVLHATSLRIPVVEVEGGTLTAIAGFDGHQGIALIVAPRRWASPEDILAVAGSRHEPPLVLVLDSLEDPQNVGTLLRTAEASGVHGAVFPTRHQAPLSPAAVKASAGAVEHLALAPVDDLPGTLADLHARGLRIVGADGEAPLTARDADLRGPIAIVVGSEGQGLGPAIRRRCDLVVRIPMHGRIESLNAAVAGSILLYEAAAQRRLPDPGPGTAEARVDAAPGAAAPEPDVAPEPSTAVAPESDAAPEPDAAPAPEPAPAAAAPEPDAGQAPAESHDGASGSPASDAGPDEPDHGPATPEPDAAQAVAKAKPKVTRTRRAKTVAAEPAPPPDPDDLLPEGPGEVSPEV
ncbi:MAG: 23S rRNA (guanosine(2251)-2'-O)-methyltransferase RlmB [Candidatus Limnocylindrales bacterium]